MSRNGTGWWLTEWDTIENSVASCDVEGCNYADSEGTRMFYSEDRDRWACSKACAEAIMELDEETPYDS